MAVKKNTTRAAALEVTPAQIGAAFADLMAMVADYNQQEGTTTAANKSASKKVAVEEPEETYTPEEIHGMKIVELRELAVELGLDEQKVKNNIIAELTEKGYIVDEDGDEDEDEDELEDEEEDEDEDGEDEDDEGYSREELEDMTLADLRKLAKEEGIKVPRGADQDALVELILGEDDEDEDDDDEADDDDTDSDSDDEEEEEITEEEIRAMSLQELQGLAKELKVKVTVPRNVKTSAAKQKFYAQAILDSVADDDE